MKRSKQAKQQPILQWETLEPRILLSAGTEALLVDNSIFEQDINQSETVLVLNQNDLSNTEQTQNSIISTTELVIIDSDTPNFDLLLNDIQRQSDHQLEILVLDTTKDGIKQTNTFLNQYDNVSALHFISHGSDGNINLGNTNLSVNTLSDYSDDLQSWQEQLTADADILIYGCDVAETEDGKDFVDILSVLTGADVAASDDLTGHESRNADWELEYKSGVVETDIAISLNAQQEWNETLAEPQGYVYTYGDDVAWPGQTLDTRISHIGNRDTNIDVTYHWERDGNIIVGETTSYYTLTLDDVGTTVVASVTYTDNDGVVHVMESRDPANVLTPNDPHTGTISITGDYIDNHMLTIDTSGLADPEGINQSSFTYVWFRNGSYITSETTDNTYTLTDADVGDTSIRGRAYFYDNEGHKEMSQFIYGGNVLDENDLPTGEVTIDGDITVEQTVTANTSTIADEDGLTPFSFQWKIDGTAVGGAISDTYTLDAADAGKLLTVEISYTDGATPGTAETVTSAASTIRDFNNVHTGNVTIHAPGGTAENQVLTTTNDLVDTDILGTLTYQWLRNGVDIDGATSDTYTLDDADIDQSITLKVSYIDGQLYSETSISNAITSITNTNDAPTGNITITGNHTEDYTLGVDVSGVSDIDGIGNLLTEATYQWQRDGVDIDGAIADTYIPVDLDVYKILTVKVSYMDGRGTLETIISSPSDPIANINDSTYGGGVIVGDRIEGSILTATVGTISDEDGDGTLRTAPTYQWYRNDVAVENATSISYLLGRADVGANIKVEILFIDGHGTAEARRSGNTQPIPAFNYTPTGSGIIEGTKTEDQVLTVNTTGISDINGISSFDYKWIRITDSGYTFISGATTDTYTLTDADVGENVGVQLVLHDNDGFTNLLIVNNGVITANINDAPGGPVWFTGNPEEHKYLVAQKNMIADDDGLGDLYTSPIYQWFRDGAVIAGETSNNYLLTEEDGNKEISASISYTDGNGTLETVVSDDVTITPTNSGISSHASLTGELKEDQTLTIDTSTLVDPDGNGPGDYTYKWYRYDASYNESIIDGATDQTYTLTDADVGHFIYGVVNYTDGDGFSNDSGNGDFFTAVAAINDVHTGTVTITGNPTEDETLTATNNIADTDGLSTVINYQWQRDGVDIQDATSDKYTLGDIDVGKAITVVAKYTDDQGFDEIEISSQSVIANVNDILLGNATITGIPTEDKTLTANTALVDDDGLGTIEYQWLRNGVDIDGAKSSTYKLSDDDVGKSISFVINHTDNNGTLESISSNSTSLITNVNDSPTGTVVVEGIIEEDQTLTATSSLADPDGVGVLTYQWQRDGVDITGATSDKHTLGDIDVGTAISVRVSYNDGYGTPETITSTPTISVANINDAPNVVADNLLVNEDSSLIIKASKDLLANDSDIDGDSLSITSFSQPSHGTLVTNGNGMYKYTPTSNFNGADSFTTVISDGNGGEETVTVNISVSNINDRPVIQNESYKLTSLINNQSIGNVIATDVDSDDSLTYSLVNSGNTNGFNINPNTGEIFISDKNLIDITKQSLTFVVRATDTSGAGSNATIKISLSLSDETPKVPEQKEIEKEESSKKKVADSTRKNDINIDTVFHDKEINTQDTLTHHIDKHENEASHNKTNELKIKNTHTETNKHDNNNENNSIRKLSDIFKQNEEIMFTQNQDYLSLIQLEEDKHDNKDTEKHNKKQKHFTDEKHERTYSSIQKVGASVAVGSAAWAVKGAAIKAVVKLNQELFH